MKINKKIIVISFVSVLVLSLVACGKNTAKQVTNIENTTAQTDENSEKQLPRTKFVDLCVLNSDGGIEVRILDKDNAIITKPFTVCIVKQNGDPVLDAELSETVTGMEYEDTDGDGILMIGELESGKYEVYLRPIPEYLFASPIPITISSHVFDAEVVNKIKKKEDIDVEKEDKAYTQEVKTTSKSKDTVKFNNIVSSGFILGKSKSFVVNKPELTEDGDVVYEKVRAREVDPAVKISDYVIEGNEVELIISGEMKTGYVYSEKRYDPRIEEYYVSEAIIKENGEYYMYSLIPHMYTGKEDVYIGWYSKKGKHYYNDENGYPVTGWRKIDGLWYYFDENGRKASVTGVDVSEYQEDIDWAALKESGIDFAIIRCGFRGYGSGVLVEDEKFQDNIRQASEVGMPFGVYIFSQAVNEAEAAEEASMILELCQGYELTLPYAIDIEACGTKESPGRQNLISTAERTRVINTFSEVIRSQGKEPMLYSNKSYLENQIDMDALTDCQLWYAMWPDEADINGDAGVPDPNQVPNMKVNIWQYSSKGVVGGIEPVVDLNAWIPVTE